MVSLSTLVIATLTLLPSALGNLIYTPVNVVQCGAHDLTWTGIPPFTLDVWPSCDSDSNAVDPVYTYYTNSTKAIWTVNIKAGQSFMLSVTDAKGNEAYTNDVTVKNSNTTSCLGKKAVFVIPGSPSLSPPSALPSDVGAPGDVGASPSPSPSPKTAGKPGGTLGTGGALSAFSPRVEVSVFVVVASILVGFAH